jgi:hypothetical protein
MLSARIVRGDCTGLIWGIRSRENLSAFLFLLESDKKLRRCQPINRVGAFFANNPLSKTLQKIPGAISVPFDWIQIGTFVR